MRSKRRRRKGEGGGGGEGEGVGGGAPGGLSPFPTSISCSFLFFPSFCPLASVQQAVISAGLFNAFVAELFQLSTTFDTDIDKVLSSPPCIALGCYAFLLLFASGSLFF